MTWAPSWPLSSPAKEPEKGVCHSPLPLGAKGSLEMSRFLLYQHNGLAF